MKKSVNERVNFLFESNKIDNSRFCRETGMSKQSLSNIRLNKTSPNAESLRLILDFFKTANARWLITGVGEITQTESTEIAANSTKKVEDLLLERLQIENEGLKRENILLREMIDLLKGKMRMNQ